MRASKRFTSFVWNEDMNDNIKITKSLEDPVLLIDEVTETVKHGKKIQQGGFGEALLAPLAASLVQPRISSVVKGISGRGVRREEKRDMDEIF